MQINAPLPRMSNVSHSQFLGLEIAQLLRALAALSEDQDSIPRTHKVTHN